jgi:hypothetical protein
MSRKFHPITIHEICNADVGNQDYKLPDAQVYVVAALHSGSNLHITFDCDERCSDDFPCNHGANYSAPTIHIAGLLHQLANKHPERVHFSSCDLAIDLNALRTAVYEAGLRCVVSAYRNAISWSDGEATYLQHGLPHRRSDSRHSQAAGKCRCMRNELVMVDNRPRRNRT